MAGRRNPQEQISFEFTVPSQSDEYSQAQARMAASNPIPMSASRTSVQGGLNTPTASVVGRRKRDQLDDDINEDEQYERGDRSDNEEDEDEDDQGEEDDDDEWIPNSAGHSSRPSGAGSVGGNGAMGPSDRARSHPHSSQQFQHPNQRLTSSGAHALELSIPSHTTFTEGNNNNNNMLFAPEPGPHFGDSGGEGGTGSASISRRGSTSNLTKSDGKKPVKPAALGPDGLPPPKKKRRRQALSCTECKRRKIRCDRAQPCAPCSRRGEGDKCKWNILEPVEKFVTRKEYDEIKDSLTRLESILTTPGTTAPVAADEVKAAVDIVKSKAGLISKVIAGGSSTLSSVPPQARGKSQPQGTVPRNGGPFDDDNTQGRDFRTGLSSANDSDPNSALSSGGPFSYQPFPLNVPAHSPIGGPDYMAGPYNHSPLGTSHFGSAAPNQSVSPGYFPPTPGSYQHQQRPPEIHLGGLVVEDQSPQSAYLRGANSLSTLASVANSSSRADMGHLGNSLHQRSLSGRMEDVPHSHTSSLTLAPIPAHPTTSSVSGDLSRAPSRASLIPASLPLESNTAKRDELRRILRDVLPTKEICDRLMGHYFEKVEWSLNLLHRATFLRAYEAFWFLPEKRRIPQDFNYTPSMGSDWDNGLNGSLASHSQSGFGDSYGRGSMGGSDSGDKGSKSDSNSENNLSSAWISLLFALLCVAMERLGFYDSKALGIVEEVDDYKRLCKSLFEASQTIMVLGNFLNSKSIETVQTLILHLHCQQSVAETNWETHTAVIIAAAARIGNMMGLNKLTPEKPGPSRAPGFLKRELGRRAWWSLIEKDWSLSTRTGYTYAINPNQNFCDVPANLDWGEPEAVLNNSIPRSREIWTHASLFLAKADIAKANRELLDRYNSSEGVSYAFLMNHHAQLEQNLSRIPSALIHLDGDLEHTNIQVQWDRLLYTFHSHYSIILTHRPYIVTALLDAKNHENEEKTGHTRISSVYTNSLEASLRSAETILDTIEEAKALDYPGVQWWQTTLYCYVAAVVLLAERWYTSEAKPGSLKSEDAEERKRKIVAVIALLRDQGESIDLFSEAANALDSLLDATTSARRKARRSSSKRGMDITDVVNPINIPSRPGSNASTPSFVREWIERPNTPLSPPRLLPEHERSLSTISLTPGVALTADNSFDSHFWARVFDLQFGSPVAITDPFFPSAAKETNQNDAMEGVMGTAGGSMGMKNTVPLWNALSGQIGNMNPNERSW